MAGDLELAGLQGAYPLDRAFGTFNPSKDILAFLKKELRFRGRGQLSVGPKEQGKTKLVLERPDHCRDSRLGSTHRARCLTDRAGKHDFAKRGELPEG